MNKIATLKHIFALSGLAAVLSLPLTPGARAGSDNGGDISGGGDAKHCGNSSALKEFLGGKLELADLAGAPYSFALPREQRPSDDLGAQQVIDDVMQTMEASFPEEARLLKTTLSRLQFEMTASELPTLNTGYVPNLIERTLLGCNKFQIATQDFASGRVLVYEPIYKRLGSVDQAFLKFHEAYLYLSSAQTNDLLSMETQTRNKVRTLYRRWKLPTVSCESIRDGRVSNARLLKYSKNLLRIAGAIQSDMHLILDDKISPYALGDVRGLFLSSFGEANPETVSKSNACFPSQMERSIQNGTVRDFRDLLSEIVIPCLCR